MNQTKTSLIVRGFGTIALAALCLAGAALAAFVAWFFISDMIGDWYEAYGPEIPVPGQTPPSYLAAHGSVRTIVGITLWLLPSFLLLLLSFRLVFRAFTPPNQATLNAPN